MSEKVSKSLSLISFYALIRSFLLLDAHDIVCFCMQVQEWKGKRFEYVKELGDLLDDASTKFYNDFQTNIVKKEEFTKYEKGAKLPADFEANKRIQP